MKNRAKGTSSQYHKILYKDIGMCQGWNEYDPFKEWALSNGYADDLTLDRIDNLSDYSPENCRWATPATQARNTRRTVLNEVAVKAMRFCHYEMGKTIKQIAEAYKLNYFTVYGAVKKDKWKGI